MTLLTHPTQETIPTLLHFPPPLHLKHRPFFMLPYEPFDGRYARNTDAKYLSIGHAQWRSNEDPYPISAKVWRYPDNKWSRMSEELPLHRVIDLCILMTEALFARQGRVATFPAGTFAGQQEPVELNMLEGLPEEFESEGEKAKIKKRLGVLYKALYNAGIGEEQQR
jgi:hypothetical protein